MGWGEPLRRRSASPTETAAAGVLADTVASFLAHPATSRRELMEAALRVYDAEAPHASAAGRRDARRRILRSITPGQPAAP